MRIIFQFKKSHREKAPGALCALSFCDSRRVHMRALEPGPQLRVAGWESSHLAHRVGWGGNEQGTTVALAGCHPGTVDVRDGEGRGKRGTVKWPHRI